MQGSPANMRSFLAAAVTLPFVGASACMINFFSLSAAWASVGALEFGFTVEPRATIRSALSSGLRIKLRLGRRFLH